MSTDKFKPSTKLYKWLSVKAFFRVMSNFEGVPQLQFPTDPVFNYEGDLDELENIIPIEIYYTLDNVFIDYADSLPIDIQLIYWLLRLIPSRINEVLDMDLKKCIRPVGDKHIITIPVPKNSTVFQLKQKMVYINNKARIEKFLIELINKQIKISKKLQKRVKEEGLTPNLLFTTCRLKSLNCGKVPFSLENHEYSNTLIGRVSDERFDNFLRKIIILADKVLDESGDKKYNLRDENNKLIILTSHKLRREAISGMIDYGMLIQDVAFLAGLDVEQTVWTYYDSSASRSIRPTPPIFDINANHNTEEAIKVSDIMLNESSMDEETSLQTDFKRTVVADSVLKMYQKSENLRHVPLVTSNGSLLGNCGGDFYNCEKIKNELICINCDFCKKDDKSDSLEHIETAIERYRNDLEFFKLNGNVMSERIAQSNLERFIILKESILANKGKY